MSHSNQRYFLEHSEEPCNKNQYITAATFAFELIQALVPHTHTHTQQHIQALLPHTHTHTHIQTLVPHTHTHTHTHIQALVPHTHTHTDTSDTYAQIHTIHRF